MASNSEPDLSHSSSNQLVPGGAGVGGASNNSNNLNSRDGSFSSVTSSSATYHTAREDTNNSSSINSSSLYVTPAGSGDLRPEFYIAKKGEASRRRESSTTTTDSNSATLEADSLHSGGSSGMGEEIFGDEEEEVGLDGARLSLSSSTSDNAIEVREDISRICNTIAESEDLDRDKKTEIEQALKLGDLYKLGKLATTSGGLLSSKINLEFIFIKFFNNMWEWD